MNATRARTLTGREGTCVGSGVVTSGLVVPPGAWRPMSFVERDQAALIQLQLPPAWVSHGREGNDADVGARLSHMRPVNRVDVSAPNESTRSTPASTWVRLVFESK